MQRFQHFHKVFVLIANIEATEGLFPYNFYLLSVVQQ
jgi:hypothetical protein